MKTKPGLAAAVLLATPFVLVAQTPTPTPKSGPAAGAYASGKSYSGVQLQQGRVQTDADWNEQLQACKRENEALSRKMKAHANNLEIQVRQLQAAADKADASGKSSDASGKSSRDHSKAMKDSIQKLLDQIAEMNRAAKF